MGNWSTSLDLLEKVVELIFDPLFSKFVDTENGAFIMRRADL